MVISDGIVLGGGIGKRFGGDLPKQFQLLDEVPVLVYGLRSLMTLGLRQVVLAVPSREIASVRALLDRHLKDATTPIRVVPGGERRQDSSRLALEACEEGTPAPERVLIHDACRPFLSRFFLSRLQEKLQDRSYGAWIPVVPVTETLKRIDNGLVAETIDRELIKRVQTPQIFEYTVIRSLATQAKELDGTLFTDDASLCEYYGIPVGAFEGDVRNLKLTYPFEMDSLRAFVRGESASAETPCEPASDTTYTA